MFQIFFRIKSSYLCPKVFFSSMHLKRGFLPKDLYYKAFTAVIRNKLERLSLIPIFTVKAGNYFMELLSDRLLPSPKYWTRMRVADSDKLVTLVTMQN
jgi:hypothetical protein